MQLTLLLPLQWVLTGGFVTVLIKCLLICPIMPQLLGLVLESRWVPWSPRYQFLAFVPGNPFLACFIALCSTTQPVGSHLFLNGWSRWVFLAGAGAFYLGLTLWLDPGVYTKRQMLSPTKVYHNLLYFWYGYLAATVWAGMLQSDISAGRKILCSLAGMVWLLCLVADNFTPKDVLQQRFKFAHDDQWTPIWKTGFRIRRRTQSGYALAA